jgi:hypothetical protein
MRFRGARGIVVAALGVGLLLLVAAVNVLAL